MAPISPSYVWEETETSVIVTATCRGATPANTDAFSSPHYVSVNSPPFFLELDLHGRIDSIASSTAVRRGGEIELRLPKAQPGTPPWHATRSELASCTPELLHPLTMLHPHTHPRSHLRPPPRPPAPLLSPSQGIWGRLLIELPKPERLRRRAESRAAAEALAIEQVALTLTLS